MKRLTFGSAVLAFATLASTSAQAGHWGHSNSYYCSDGYDSNDVAVALGASAAIVAGAVVVNAMIRADASATTTGYAAPASAPLYADVEAAYATGYGDGRTDERGRGLGIGDSVSSGVLQTRPRASDPRPD